MANDASTAGKEGVDYLSFLRRRWTQEDYVKLALFAAIAGTLYYFFGVVRVYEGLPISAWAWGRYAPQYNFEHGKLVLPIFAFLVWYHREEIAKAPKVGCNQGLIWVALGCFIYAAGARTLQGRVGMAAGPVLLYGIVLYVWGRQVARILLFPIAFLIFMIPVAAIEQATFRLQFLVTGISRVICGLIGIPLYTVGTTLCPVDQSFHGFQIAEGCSGIRSLMAMIMVTAIYVHLTETKLWKKATILFFSTGFAIIGNAGRIVTIFVVAKFFGEKFAGGQYHEASGYVSFPIALGAMLLMSKLLDLPVSEAARAIKEGGGEAGDGPATKRDDPTYDY